MLPFAPFFPGGLFVVTQYTTIGSQTVAVLPGASKVIIEAINGGQSSTLSGSTMKSGKGGDYAKRTLSVSGLTALYLTVPDTDGTAVIRSSNASGAVLCQPGSVGDVMYAGGAGQSVNYGGGQTYVVGGGGAAGPSGPGVQGTNGSSSSTAGGGAPGGVPAGQGGGYAAGNPYGGGGGTYYDGDQGYPYFGQSTFHTYPGGQGWIRLTWS